MALQIKDFGDLNLSPLFGDTHLFTDPDASLGTDWPERNDDDTESARLEAAQAVDPTYSQFVDSIVSEEELKHDPEEQELDALLDSLLEQDE